MPHDPLSRMAGGASAARSGLLLAAAFLVFALPLGLMMAIEVPLGHAPDEAGHAMRAAGLLYGEIVGHRETIPRPDGGTTIGAMVRTNPALGAVVTVPVAPLRHEPMATTRQMIAAGHAVPWWGRPVAVDLRTIAGYFPAFYLPGAVAIGATRLLGGSPYDAFLAMRLANLGLFGALGAAGLLLARRGAALLFGALLLPMTLSLAASANIDGLTIGATVLAMACISRAAGAEAGAVSRSGWYRGAARLLAGVGATKLPYLPFAGLLLLPLDWRTAGAAERRRRIIAMLLACLPALAWAAWAGPVAAVPHAIPTYAAGPLWPGPRPALFDASDPAAQLRVLLAGPWHLLTVPAATFGRDGGLLAMQFVGVLGWLNVMLPGWLYAAWGIALGAAALADLGGAAAPRGQRWLRAALVLCLAFAAVLGVVFALYLTWTPVGDALAEGVQGRYFLPLLPLLAQALPVFPRARRLRWLVLVPLVIAALDVAVLPRVVLDWYYPQ